MELNKYNAYLEFPSGTTGTKIIGSLTNVQMHVRDSENDVILRIRMEKKHLLEFIKYILKNADPDDSSPDYHAELKESARRLIISKKVLAASDIIGKFKLTGRQVDIMERLLKGLINKEIAADLGLECNTVRNHLQSIYRKLKVGNRSEAILEYQKCLKNPIQ